MPLGMVWYLIKHKTGCDLDEISPKKSLAKGSQNRDLPRISIVYSEVDKVTPPSIPKAFVQDARILGFRVDDLGYDTGVHHAWGSNTFPALAADSKCPEHITKMLVNPAGY